MHFIADEDNPKEIVAMFRERMKSGSYLVLSHGSGGENPDAAEEASKEWQQARSSLIPRSPSEIEELFAGLEMVGPGLVTTTEWGTNAPTPAEQAVILCGVGKVM